MQSVTKPTRRRRKCGWCREWFQPSERGRPPLYCSPSCRQRAYERRLAKRPRALVAAVRADIAETEFRAEVRERAQRYLRVLGYDPEIPADKLSELVKIERLERDYRKKGGRGRRPR